MVSDLLVATTEIGIDKGTIVSEKPRTQESRKYKFVIDCYFSLKQSLITPFLVLNVVNMLFHTSFYWKWPATCHVFVKWPVGEKWLDHAGPELSHCPLFNLGSWSGIVFLT